MVQHADARHLRRSPSGSTTRSATLETLKRPGLGGPVPCGLIEGCFIYLDRSHHAQENQNRSRSQGHAPPHSRRRPDHDHRQRPGSASLERGTATRSKKNPGKRARKRAADPSAGAFIRAPPHRHRARLLAPLPPTAAVLPSARSPSSLMGPRDWPSPIFQSFQRDPGVKWSY